MTAPTLSVLMPNYNHARFAPDALEGVLTQTYRPLEIIILDDASTDHSLEVIKRYRAREPDLIHVVKNDRNHGVLANIPRLLSIARGNYLFFAAMDDRILPGFLERSMSLLGRHPDAGLCSTLSWVMSEQSILQGLVKLPVVLSSEGFIDAKNVPIVLNRHGNWFMGNTTIFRRTALEEAGGFIPDLGPYCDGFASLVIALQRGACFIPEPLAVWRRMPETYSSRTCNDVDIFLRYLELAEQLMRTQYAQLFPADYVDKWKKDMYFGVASRAATNPRSEWISDIRRLVPATTTMDSWFDVTVRMWPAAARKLAKPYLFGKLKRGQFFRMLQRRVRHQLLP